MMGVVKGGMTKAEILVVVAMIPIRAAKMIPTELVIG